MAALADARFCTAIRGDADLFIGDIAEPTLLAEDADTNATELRTKLNVANRSCAFADLLGSGMGDNIAAKALAKIQKTRDDVSARGARAAAEAQFALLECLLEGGQKDVAEAARENPHGQQKTRAAGDPAVAVGGEPATGHDAMQVGVVAEIAAPAVQRGQSESQWCQEAIDNKVEGNYPAYGVWRLLTSWTVRLPDCGIGR